MMTPRIRNPGRSVGERMFIPALILVSLVILFLLLISEYFFIVNFKENRLKINITPYKENLLS